MVLNGVKAGHLQLLIFEIRIEEKVGIEGFQIFWPIAFVTHCSFVCSIRCLPLRDLSLLFFGFAIYNSYCSCCSWSCFIKVSICMQEEEKCLEHMEAHTFSLLGHCYNCCLWSCWRLRGFFSFRFDDWC